MKEEDKIINGNYDGIQEYDNDLPRWWIWLFYLTIFFAAVYPIWYHIYPGETTQVKLAADMNELREKQNAAAKALAATSTIRDEGQLIKLSQDSEHVAQGKVVFAARCAVCHGPEAQGVIGPNLTDNYWIHGAKLEQLRTVIENGVLDKGMLAWKGILSAEEIDNVIAFIHTLQGTTPANPKAPQGDLVQP